MRMIFTFGCPRSGTTFLWKAARTLGHDALVIRVPETRLAHPRRTRDGLVELVRTFAVHKVLLIRIVRHPLDIVESVLAGRRLDFPTGSLGRRTDERICRMIIEESESWAEQLPLLVGEENCTVVEARYEALATEEGMKRLVRAVRAFVGKDARGLKDFRTFLDTFGRVPVRMGRLELGIGRQSTDEERDYFEEALAAVILREGYEGVEPMGDGG